MVRFEEAKRYNDNLFINMYITTDMQKAGPSLLIQIQAIFNLNLIQIKIG